jgi:hypothetical protein
MRITGLALLVILSSCRTTSETSDAVLQEVQLGERWGFADCKVRSLEGDEPTERLAQFSVYLKIENQENQDKVLFTDEFSEQHAIVSKNKGETWVAGKAHLINAVDLDTKPMLLKYQATEQWLVTKTEVPTEYVDEGIQQAFEVSRYSAKGDSVTLQLLHPHQGKEPRFLVTRICGSGFGFQLGQQGSANQEMIKEASL